MPLVRPARLLEQRGMRVSVRVFLSGVLLLLLSAAACTSKPQVTVLGEKLATTDAMRELLPAFEAAKGIRVNLVTDEYVAMDRKAGDDLANHTAVYDVILQYNTALASYVQNNYVWTLAELTGPAQAAVVGDENQRRLAEFREGKHLLQKAWREVGWYKGRDGQYQPVALPFAANSMLLVYNKDLLADTKHKSQYERIYREPLAVPTTWTQFEHIAEYFSKQPNVGGVVLQGAAPYWNYFEWANIAFGMGGGVMKKTYGWDSDENTPLILTSPESVKATELYARLRNYNASGDFFATDNYRQRDRMKQGDVAMALMWTDILYDFIQGKEPGSIDSRFGFAPIPGEKSMLAGGSAYVNRRTENLKEAVEFVLWLQTPEVQAKLLARGLCSPVMAAYDNSEAKKIPYVPALRDSLARGVYMLEAGPDADAIEVKLSNALQRMFREKLEAGHVLREAQQDVDATRREIFRQLKQATQGSQK